MSIIANNIQYSNGNIQTCSLVIDSKAFQIQYQDGSYKVSSSGEATAQSNDPVSSSSGTGITNTVASSGNNVLPYSSGTMSNTSGTMSNTSGTMSNTSGTSGAGLSEESSTAEKKVKKRINTKKLSLLMNNQ